MIYVESESRPGKVDHKFLLDVLALQIDTWGDGAEALDEDSRAVKRIGRPKAEGKLLSLCAKAHDRHTAWWLTGAEELILHDILCGEIDYCRDMARDGNLSKLRRSEYRKMGSSCQRMLSNLFWDHDFEMILDTKTFPDTSELRAMLRNTMGVTYWQYVDMMVIPTELKLEELANPDDIWKCSLCGNSYMPWDDGGHLVKNLKKEICRSCGLLDKRIEEVKRAVHSGARYLDQNIRSVGAPKTAGARS